MHHGNVPAGPMDPRTTRARDDANSEEDHRPDHHPELRRSCLDGSPRKAADQNQKAEDICEKSHTRKSGQRAVVVALIPEITKDYARQFGSGIVPNSRAMLINDQLRARLG